MSSADRGEDLEDVDTGLARSFVCFVAIGKHLVRLLDMAAVDFVEIDKRFHVDGVLRF